MKQKLKYVDITPRIESFETREQAEKQALKIQGWKWKVVKTYSGNFIIECNKEKYLYTDGYVR